MTSLDEAKSPLATASFNKRACASVNEMLIFAAMPSSVQSLQTRKNSYFS